MSEAFKKESTGYIALERVYLSKDGKLVHEGDSRAAQFLAAKGGHVPEKLAKKLGLDRAVIEPLQKKESEHGFDAHAHGGFNHMPPKSKAIAPEIISERSTRPEAPPSRR